MHPYAWAWDFEGVVLVPALTLAYAVAIRGHATAPWRIACFTAGMLLIVVAFVTPLQTLSVHYLLTAHLLQNVVLAEWAPVLCVLGIPPSLAGSIARVRLVRSLVRPWVALPVWLATYFVWHVPALYDAALRNPSSLLHLEHVCYFAAGCLMWWPIVHAVPWNLTAGGKAAYLVAAFFLASPLGLLFALIPDPIYGFYEAAPRIWGLSALADQQVAGMTMAGEQAVVFFAAFLVFLVRFLSEEEARDDREAKVAAR